MCIWRESKLSLPFWQSLTFFQWAVKEHCKNERRWAIIIQRHIDPFFANFSPLFPRLTGYLCVIGFSLGWFRKQQKIVYCNRTEVEEITRQTMLATQTQGTTYDSRTHIKVLGVLTLKLYHIKRKLRRSLVRKYITQWVSTDWKETF